MSASFARDGHSAPSAGASGGSAQPSCSNATADSSALSLSAPARVIDIGVYGGRSALELPDGAVVPSCPGDEFLMDARQVAARLGVSERFVRDHTYRRSPQIRGVKMGKLMRYRRVDVDLFLTELAVLPPSRRLRRGV